MIVLCGGVLVVVGLPPAQAGAGPSAPSTRLRPPAPLATHDHGLGRRNGLLGARLCSSPCRADDLRGKFGHRRYRLSHGRQSEVFRRGRGRFSAIWCCRPSSWPGSRRDYLRKRRIPTARFHGPPAALVDRAVALQAAADEHVENCRPGRARVGVLVGAGVGGVVDGARPSGADRASARDTRVGGHGPDRGVELGDPGRVGHDLAHRPAHRGVAVVRAGAACCGGRRGRRGDHALDVHPAGPRDPGCAHRPRRCRGCRDRAVRHTPRSCAHGVRGDRPRPRERARLLDRVAESQHRECESDRDHRGACAAEHAVRHLVRASRHARRPDRREASPATVFPEELGEDQAFSSWVAEHGRHTYLQFLASHLRYTLAGPLPFITGEEPSRWVPAPDPT